MDTTTKLTDTQIAALHRLAHHGGGYGCAGHPKPARGLVTQVHTGTAKALVARGLAEVTHIRTRPDRTAVTYYAATDEGVAALAELDT